MKLTDEEFEREWRSAEICVDDLLEFYKSAGWDRRVFFNATMDGTLDLPEGDTMTVLCNAVMFERLLKEKEKKDQP